MKKMIGVVALSLLMGTSAWAIPVQWTVGSGGNDHWYEVVEAPQTAWDDARVQALGMWYSGLQAHLATITSEEELLFIDSVIALYGFGEMYVGGYQDPSNPLSATDPTAGWTWVNGEGTFPGVNSVSPFAQWNGGEPNDFAGPGSEQYLGVNLGEGMFNDEGDLTLIYGYVVEYDPDTIPNVPDAGATAPLLAGALAMAVMISRRLIADKA